MCNTVHSEDIMAGSDEHLKPLRLFDLAWNGGPKIIDEERKHLRECEQCRSILEMFARKFATPAKPGDAA
jgi:hypothetical protein